MCTKEKCSHTKELRSLETKDSAPVPAVQETLKLDENLVSKHFSDNDIKEIVTDAIFNEILFNRPELMAEFLTAATGEVPNPEKLESFISHMRFVKTMERLHKVPNFAGFVAL